MHSEETPPLEPPTIKSKQTKGKFRSFRRVKKEEPRQVGVNLRSLGPDPGGTRVVSLYLFPNLFTSASLFLALFSIVKASEGLVVFSQGAPPQAHFITACWLLLLAAVCDAIDGPVARLTRTSSSFGLQYDSLADVVAFGVAPAFLMYANLRTMDETLLPTYAPRMALGACSLYVICTAIRLARFNVQAHTEEKRHFSGLPSPGAAGTVVTAYLFVEWVSALPIIREMPDRTQVTRMMHRSILLLMVCLSALMVSEIRFEKLGNMIHLTKKPFYTLVAIVAAVSLSIMLVSYVPIILFFIFVIYLLVMVGRAARREYDRRRGKHDKGGAPAV